MTTAEAIVDQFLDTVTSNDLDRALALCAPEVVYDNVPMSAVTGVDTVRQVLAGFLGSASQIEWVVHRQVASETTVMNERSDRFEIDGTWHEIPVMGVFEVADGKITLWRDYFDMGAVNKMLGG